MKLIGFLIFSALLLVTSCSDKTKSDSKEGKDTTSISKDTRDEAWVSVDSATMMKNMMEYGTPGPMHQMLASSNGTWTGDMTMWQYDGAAPEKMVGTAVNSMILGGRYQESIHTGNMMGMPFEGRSLLAYDNAQKKFVSTWIDNWSTGFMTMSGTWDEATKSMTMTGTMPDINRPGKECSFKEKFTIIDDNTQHMEMWGPDPKTGKEYKMMEIRMTRKK
jgi:hypothetical protein